MITLQTIRDAIAREVAPLRARLRGLAVRGLVKVLDDSAGLQRAQVSCTADEVSDGVEVVTPPGLTARPSTAEALVISVGGNPQHRLALLFDRTTRYKGELAVGEAALHMGHGDQLVLLKANGDVVVVPQAAAKVLLGGAAATKHVALAEDVTARLDALAAAITAWVPVPMDGGAALKAALASWLAGSNLVASDNVYAKG